MHLPDEIVVHMLRYISNQVSVLGTAELVCKQWLRIVQSNNAQINLWLFFANQELSLMSKNLEVQHVKQYVKMHWDTFHKVDLEKAFEWLKNERIKNGTIPELRVCVIGAGGCGKSNTVIRFVSNQFVEDYDPLIEDTYIKQVSHRDIPFICEILDTGGTEDYRALQDWIHRFTNAIILVCSVDKTDSLLKDGVDKFIPFIIETMKIQSIKFIPFILVVNKIDLPLEKHVISDKIIEEQVKKYGIPAWTKISCLQDIGVPDVYSNLIDQMVKKLYWEHLLRNVEKTRKKKKCQMM